jgi:nucleoside permease NupC
MKDNKEYQNYIKTEGVEQLKRHKVLDQIELSEEQLQQAKTLQKNVFKTFNKVDEKSQSYSESVEAMGQLVMQGASTVGSLGAMGVSYAMLAKMIAKPEFGTSSLMKIVTKTLTPFAFCMLPLILIDIYTTKAQKKASRVADMLAIKELEDYRNYADYSQKPETKVFKLPESNETNLIKRFQA